MGTSASCVLAIPTAERRAFFVPQPRSVGGAEDLLVYTFWGDQVRKDLRHELTHALLHKRPQGRAAVGWDEGLARSITRCRPNGWDQRRPPGAGAARGVPAELPSSGRDVASGTARAAAADDACRLSRVVGLGPSDAARQARGEDHAAEVSAAAADHRHSRPAAARLAEVFPRPRRRWRNTWRSSPSPRPLINRERTTETQRTPRRTEEEKD